MYYMGYYKIISKTLTETANFLKRKDAKARAYGSTMAAGFPKGIFRLFFMLLIAGFCLLSTA